MKGIGDNDKQNKYFGEVHKALSSKGEMFVDLITGQSGWSVDRHNSGPAECAHWRIKYSPPMPKVTVISLNQYHSKILNRKGPKYRKDCNIIHHHHHVSWETSTGERSIHLKL